MRQGKSSQEANRLKKQTRREAKKGLPPFYTKVAREPLEKKEIYTHITDNTRADKLINGAPVIVGNMVVDRKPLSRIFKQVS